jgi:tetratricopeptide (TPR) repeat protein
VPDSRLAALAIPSLIALALLVAHSLRALPRRRAATFWAGVIAYGLLRGVAIGWITRFLGARFPYELHRPLLRILGVSAQEIAGWAVVAYLGWWLGWRFAGRRLFAQVAWGALFLGAVSWTVEAAAVAAGWWHWNVPTASALFINVPPIGLVDWFFVGSDFLLPFAAITAPGGRRRFLTLLLFPLHFGAHALPAPWLHLAHWLLLGLLLWLAVMMETEDEPFRDERSFLPLAAVAIIAADAAFVLAFVVREPALLAAIAPLAALVAISMKPRWALPIGVAAIVAGLAFRPLIVAALPPLVALALPWWRAHRRAFIASLAVIGIVAAAMHIRAAQRDEEMRGSLDDAIRARDRGDLPGAAAILGELTRDFPNSHVAFALLAEIDEKTGHAPDALALYERAASIKQDYLDGYRHGAAIALQLGDRDRAARLARRGLDVSPGDAALDYLLRRAEGRPPNLAFDSPQRAAELATLAFEVGDAEISARVLDEAIARYAGRRELYALRVRVAVAQQRRDDARRVAGEWLQRLPQDPEAQEWTRRLLAQPPRSGNH